MKRWLAVAATSTLLAAGIARAADDRKPLSDTVAYSFVFLGCNRLDSAGIAATKSKSSANVIQLQQDFKEIAALKPAPKFVFFAGDIVAGLTAGTLDLQKQLPSWVRLVTKNNPLNFEATRMVAFTGNHELLKISARKTEVPNQPAWAYWLSVMSPAGSSPKAYDFVAGNNGPTNTAANPDRVLNDESRFSYTFQHGEYLFVILNTDTQVDATTDGTVPLYWLAAQLRSAQANPAVRHVFVMGHKPIVSPDTDDVSIRPDQAAQLYAMLNNPAGDGSPGKIRAYLSAHAHEWKYYSTLPLKNGTPGKIPQIVAGNGGSPPDKNWRGEDAYFGYTLVTITRSGAMTVHSYGRKIPVPYYRQVAAPTTTRASHVIFPLPAN
ncbi:MAG: metallophosphoesterase [Betaproteobacteria bacterium]